MYSAECPICCYACSGSDPVRVALRMDTHIDNEHPDNSKQYEVIELDERQ